MASVKRNPDGPGWQVRWKTPDRQTRKRNFRVKPEAQRFAASVEHKKATDEYVDSMAGRVLLQGYAESWASAQVWRPSTQVRVDGIIANHIVPTFGDRTLSSVRTSEVESWVKGLTVNMGPGTVRGVYRVLAALYRAAVRDRLVASNPCTDVKLPKQHKRLIVPLTLAQVEAVADAVGEHYRPLVILGAGAGLRIGEALGLAAPSIDFLGRQLAVTQQAVTVRTITSLEAPKTSASVRTVPLADSVLAELARSLEGRKLAPGALLVANSDGSPIPQNRFSQVWARAAARAGLPRGTRYHDLRHTFASALIASGCSVKAVQAALGHESAAVTLNTYSHLWPSDTDRTRAAVEAFLRPEPEQLGSSWGPGQEAD